MTSCLQARRYAEFTDLKKQIILYMEELDHVPETSFEKDVVCEDEDSFCLSRDNITSLKLLICQVRGVVSFQHCEMWCTVTGQAAELVTDAPLCHVDLAAGGTQD